MSCITGSQRYKTKRESPSGDGVGRIEAFLGVIIISGDSNGSDRFFFNFLERPVPEASLSVARRGKGDVMVWVTPQISNVSYLKLELTGWSGSKSRPG
jgi:hypothetical protein